MGSQSLWAVILIVVGVLANNAVYLQDLWFGQDSITLDSWKAYLGIVVSLAIIVVGLAMAVRAARTGSSA